MTSVNRSPAKQRFSWVLLLKITIAVLMVFFIAKAVQDSRAKLIASNFALQRLHFGWLATAGMAYLAGMFPMAWNWYRLLNAMGETTPRAATLRAHYLSQLGKYVPGKAVVVALRLGLLSRFGVRPLVLFASIVAETLAMMSVGSVLAACIVAVTYRHRMEIAIAASATAVCATIPILPPVLRFGIGILRDRRISKLSGQASERPMPPLKETLTLSTIFPGWLSIFPGWVLLGFSLFATMKSLQLPSTVEMSLLDLPWIIASCAISIVAGFFSMLPGGLGVRELAMKEMIAPFYGDVVALLSPVFHRMVILTTELVLGAVLYFGFVRREANKAPGPGE